MEPSWIGRKVSVRRVVADSASARPRYSDVVGDLLSLDSSTARVHSRRGIVEIELDRVAIARLVVASTADELALEAVAAAGWQPEHSTYVGGWLLRAAGGFTSRANSVLPLRPPGMPLDEALAAARSWYAERALPLLIAVPVEARRLLDAELGERGWIAEKPTVVLAARLDMLRAEPVRAEVTIAPAPDQGWLDAYRDGSAANASAAWALLTRHERVAFASVRRDGETIAIGRGVVDEHWLGVTALEVAASHRRQGLGTAVLAALWRWGTDHDAQRSYLQVAAPNSSALTLYEQLGYWQHHVYHYRRDPDAPAMA